MGRYAYADVVKRTKGQSLNANLARKRSRTCHALGARVIHRTDRIDSFSSPLWRPSREQYSLHTLLSAWRRRTMSLAMVRITYKQPSVPTNIVPRHVRLLNLKLSTKVNNPPSVFATSVNRAPDLPTASGASRLPERRVFSQGTSITSRSLRDRADVGLGHLKSALCLCEYAHLAEVAYPAV
jgi:hypothetical protein